MTPEFWTPLRLEALAAFEQQVRDQYKRTPYSLSFFSSPEGIPCFRVEGGERIEIPLGPILRYVSPQPPLADSCPAEGETRASS